MGFLEMIMMNRQGYCHYCTYLVWGDSVWDVHWSHKTTLIEAFDSAKTFRGCPDLMWKYQFYGSAEKIYGTALNSQNTLKNELKFRMLEVC